MAEEIGRQETEANYSAALLELTQAQVKLGEALRHLQRLGINPPPPPHLRFRLTDERHGRTHKFEIGTGDLGFEGYISTGTYSDGSLGEIFITAEKKGTFVSGLLDAFAVLFSIALQSGVPLNVLTTKFKFTKFEPAGMSQNPEIGLAHSVLDYVMKWLDLKYKQEETE